MKTTIIRNGRIIDPATKRDEIGDLVIANGRIADQSAIRNPQSEITEIDAKGLIVAPVSSTSMSTCANRVCSQRNDCIRCASSSGGWVYHRCLHAEHFAVADTPSTITWIKIARVTPLA
jgi:predicted amidohydrolase